MKEFRDLREEDIDCRIQTVKDTGVSVLLYKNARVDMQILDETVGPLNWQRHHSRDNANCTVSIWDEDKKTWIEKEDTGTESNTEAEKGLASDSFKRACFTGESDASSTPRRSYGFRTHRRTTASTWPTSRSTRSASWR